MSDIARAFLERWIEENVQSGSAGYGTAGAEKLATACTNEAAEQEIPEEELAEAASELSDGDDLISVMEAALEQAEMAEDDDPDDEDEEVDV